MWRQKWLYKLTLLSLGLVLLVAACAKEATPTPAPATPAPAATLAPTPKPALKTWKNLKFQQYAVPADDARWKNLVAWTEKVEELTNGRVTIDIYPQNELVKVAEMPDAAPTSASTPGWAGPSFPAPWTVPSGTPISTS
jgi:TRAP-type C4-dicarboxylate transport system substrate-binding protein